MAETIKVTIIPYRRTGSGMTTYTDYLLKSLVRAGIDLSVVGFGSPPKFVIQEGIEYYDIGTDPYRMDYIGGPWVTYFFIREVVKKFLLRKSENSEIIHYVYPGANINIKQFRNSMEVVTSWGFASINDIIKLTTMDFNLRFLPIAMLGKLQHFYMDKTSYSKADLIIGTTSATINFWLKKIDRLSGKYIPLPVEVSSGLAISKKQEVREIKFVIGERDLERPRNNVIRTLKAFELLFKEGYKNFSIYLVGGHSEKLVGVVKSLASKGMNVLLLNYLPKMEYDKILFNSDVALVPRYILDQGAYWVLEAMAHGSCVVASNLPAFTDFVFHEVNGLLVDPFSEYDIADKLKIILNDYVLLEKLKKGAYNWVLENHNLDVVGKEHLEVYKELLSR